MSKIYQIQELGFDSWLELFKSLQKDKLIGEEKITLVWAESENRPSVPLRMCTVKANAFDEIYGQLPGEEAIDVIRALLGNCGATLSRGDRMTIQGFLEKFPSRSLLAE